MSRTRVRFPFAASGLLASLAACASAPRSPAAVLDPAAALAALPGEPRRGDELVAAGRRFHTGTPVVLWFDAGGYDAYSLAPRFAAEGLHGLRYHPGRTAPGEDRARGPSRIGAELDELRTHVHQLVLHYDACGTSRECFRVLHDVRRLSVHFLLDLDGTLYQTLDLADQAWHAAEANPVSVGVEIAHPGAFAPGAGTELDRWYTHDGDGLRLVLPERLGDGGLRTPGFVARPARAELTSGRIHGELYEQPDFTPEQYRALAHLAAALARVLPRIRLEAPRAPDGSVRSEALDAAEREAFEGVLGHLHVTRAKIDPGPAFRWDELLSAARALLSGTE